MASIDDIVQVAQNLVIAVNNLAQSFLSVEGQATYENISATTLVKRGKGRVVRVSVTTAGTTAGSVYDTASTSLTGAASLMATIPNTLGVTLISMPFQNGLVITPGASQVISVSYS